jgi:hypothetical protein
LAPLRLAVRLFERLRTVRYTILRALLRNPGDLDEHRRLRTHGDAIRHIGRHPSASSVVRLLAVKLGNRLKKVAAKMISGKRSARPGSRRESRASSPTSERSRRSAFH